MMTLTLVVPATHVADDGELGEAVEDREPHPDVPGALRHRPARLAHQLLRVDPDLDPVVEQREQGSERERCHEDRDEAELQHCNVAVQRPFYFVLLNKNSCLLLFSLIFYNKFCPFFFNYL